MSELRFEDDNLGRLKMTYEPAVFGLHFWTNLRFLVCALNYSPGQFFLEGVENTLTKCIMEQLLMEGCRGSTIHWLECPIVLHFAQVKWTVIISPSLDRPREDVAIYG
jgi:hypothetical protein